MPYLAANVSVMDFGADPTGVADSTSAFNQALAYVAGLGGGVVSAPEGTFKITPSGSPAVGVSFMGTGSAGYQNVRLVGAGMEATVLKKAAAGTLLQFSGPSSSPNTGSTHTRFCSVESIGFDGGTTFAGDVFQCYYADNLLFRDININNNADIILDSAEFWDSRFYNVVFGGSGSTTANTDAPNVYLRCSAASSGFGNSTGTTNMLVFQGCRWEAFLSGALKIAQGPGSSSGVNSVFLTDNKMETSQVNGSGTGNQASHISVDANARAVFVRGLYAYSGAFYTGYSTAQDVISWSAQDSALTDVLISDGGSATIANGVTVNSTVASQNAVVRNVYGTYTTNPTGKHVNIGTSTGSFVVDNCHSSATDPSILNQMTEWITASSGTNTFGSSVAGDSVHRFVANANGGFSWGGGALAADVVMVRALAGVLGLTTGSLLIGASDLGDGGAGVLKLANAATLPTANPTGGAVVYARNGGLWDRDPNGVISAMVSPSEFSTSPTGCLGETFPRCLGSNATATQAIGATTGTVYMMGIWLPAGLTITNMNWITGSTAAVTPAHWWLGIANSAGLQQAATADQLTAAIAANSLITKALTATYTTTATGLYYLLLSVTAATNPTATGLPVPISQMNLATPVLAGVSAATQSAPGTNGTTSYTAPASAGGIPYVYLT
jgi:hypothetical protein